MEERQREILPAMKAEGGHEPRAGGSLEKLREARRWILQKGLQPFGHDFSPGRLLTHGTVRQ